MTITLIGNTPAKKTGQRSFGKGRRKKILQIGRAHV